MTSGVGQSDPDGAVGAVGLDAALAGLPHGREFRFLDRLVALEPGKRGVGEYTLRGDEAFLAGHFPGDPLMPGVLLIEAGAQLAGVVAQADPSEPALRRLRLAAVRQARFRAGVRPGQTVRLEAEVLRRMAGLVHARVQASVASGLAMEAEVTLAGAPAPEVAG